MCNIAWIKGQDQQRQPNSRQPKIEFTLDSHNLVKYCKSRISSIGLWILFTLTNTSSFFNFVAMAQFWLRFQKTLISAYKLGFQNTLVPDYKFRFQNTPYQLTILNFKNQFMFLHNSKATAVILAPQINITRTR